MKTPTPRDVARMLESMADQEPPDDLLEKLEATVPEVLSTPITSVRPQPRILSWNRNRLLVAALGLAAVIAVGFGMALFLQGPETGLPTAGVEVDTATPTATAIPSTPPIPSTATVPQAQRSAPTSPTPRPRAVLAGRATDGREGLPGVTVIATAPDSGKTWTAVTAGNGRYELKDLPPGEYEVEFGIEGFQTVDTKVKVASNTKSQINARMAQATHTEEVTVTGVLMPREALSAMSAVTTVAPQVDGYASSLPDELLVVEQSSLSPGDGDAEPNDSEAVAGRAALQVRDADGETVGELPLRHTGVRADIGGFMARTVVTQEYVNTFTEPIEAVYVFPLGAMAAVNDFVMEVGDRRIVGVVRPREEAERIYQEARERGQTASLLTQERPNIFTQNVANIAPGGTVTITITTFETLTHDRGTFEYVFPMVVGPRYIPGGATAATPRAVGGGGWSPATTVVPDADRITPPVLRPGERSGHDIDLTVRLDAGLPITEVRSVAHKVDISEHGTTRRTIKLAGADTIPNRDFVLRWTVAGERLQTGVLTYRDHGEGYLALLVQPPLDPADALVSAREITFVLDVSGSMSGVPVETSKALVRQVLDSLRPADAFNIFVFSGGSGQLWDEPRGSSPESIAEAREFLTTLHGSGGTEMLAGLKRAITGTHDPARLQMFVFCTDGFVGDEERILAFVQQERRNARFFAFGIGSSVNRYLIDGVGRLGGGASMVVLPREADAADRAAERFFSMIDAPVLVDAAIDWNGLPVVDSYPERLGDLFTGGAFTVVARFTRPAAGVAYLTGRLGTKAVRFPIVLKLPRREREHPELAPVWARRRIADLSEAMLTAPKDEAVKIKQAITDLAIEYRLASPFTSFVAVDESEVRGTGTPKRVHQPVPMPQDVRYEGVFGPPR